MKRQILLIFLLTAVILSPILAQPTKSSQIYGIELEKDYSGAEVVQIINDVLEESDKSIDEAYAKGYKAGLLEAAPDSAYWQAFSVESGNISSGFNLSSFSIGTAAGVIITIVVTSIINGVF